MIKSLSNIIDLSTIDQNGENDILSFSKVDFNDSALGSGGFGSVHRVQSIDGISQKEFVLKIYTDEEKKQHAYDTIKLLHDKLKKNQFKTGIPVYHDLPELLGLPFAVFKAYDSISDQHCVAFLMYNLNELNYEDYGSDNVNLTDYKKLRIPDKLYLAYQLTKTIDFLHKIQFIHFDIKPDSLFFNSGRIQLAIIDYDSGYHFDEQDKPSTVGSITHWISGRFRNIIGKTKSVDEFNTLDRLREEYWQLANGVFEIVFGVMPFFFLSDVDDNTKQAYLKEFEWPTIDYTSPLFNKSNTQQHQSIVSIISELEKGVAADLIHAFKRVFNKGYKDETKRLTSTEWKDLLLSLNQSLESNSDIINFTSNKSKITRKNENVEFNLNVRKYNALYLDDKLIPIDTSSVTIAIKDKSEVCLKAVNDFDVVESILEIDAIKVQPEIVEFISSKAVRDSLSPVKISWRTSNVDRVELLSFGDDFSAIDNVNVEPVQKTPYTLKVFGYFDEIIEETIYIDTVKPIIKYFESDVNLNFGIDNVDLKWDLQNVESFKFTPEIDSMEMKGVAHIKLSKETEYRLDVKGLFEDKSISINATPFPLPVIGFRQMPIIDVKLSAITNINLNTFPTLNINSDRFDLEIDPVKIESVFDNSHKITTPHFISDNLLDKKQIELNKWSIISLSNKLTSIIKTPVQWIK